MAIQVWLPLNGNLNNYGLTNISATNNGATVDNNGKIGKCYSFDGTDDYINLGNIGQFFDGSAFSICFWVYSLEDKTRAAVFSAYGLSSTSNFFGLEINSSSGTYCNNNLRFDWLGVDTYSPSDFVTYNEWTHICVTYDGVNKIRMYKNGELIQTTTRALNAIQVGNVYYLGRDSRTGTTAFSGKLNDFRIYDYTLSAREVKEISKGLVLHYMLAMPGQENLLSRYVAPGAGSPTSTATGGRTTWLGDYKITIPATENADTYFNLFTSEQLTMNDTYTISCQVSGLKDGSYYNFPLYTQSNSSMGLLKLNHNGLCYLTFTMTYETQTAATGANGETVYRCFMDDNGRSIASGQGAITLSNFKLEKGSVPTPWIPNKLDTLYAKMGFNDGIEHDASGYEHNGIKSGTLTYSSDTPRYNCSSTFNGSNTYIEVDSLPSETRTISVWLKTSWSQASGYRIAVHDKTTGLAVGWSGIQLITYVGSTNGGSGSRIDTTGHYIANQWNHIVVIKTGDTTRDVYINGQLMTPSGVNYWGGGHDKLNIGNRILNGSYSAYFNGQISDLRAYSTALSADNVLELYHTPISLSNNGTLLTQGEYVEN